MKERKMIGRIRYVENWHDEGEHFVFEHRFEDEDDWTFESASPLCHPESSEMIPGSGDWLHYEALTKIREWSKSGITDICWR